MRTRSSPTPAPAPGHRLASRSSLFPPHALDVPMGPPLASRPARRIGPRGGRVPRQRGLGRSIRPKMSTGDRGIQSPVDVQHPRETGELENSPDARMEDHDAKPASLFPGALLPAQKSSQTLAVDKAQARQVDDDDAGASGRALDRPGQRVSEASCVGCVELAYCGQGYDSVRHLALLAELE